MAGSTKLGTYQYEVTIDGKKAVLEIQNIEQKTVAAGKKIEKVGSGIGQQFQNWIKSGLGFNAILGGATEAMMKLKRAISEGIERAAANNEKARNSFRELGNGIQNMFTKIGEFLLPVITALSEAANKLLKANNISTGGSYWKGGTGTWVEDVLARRERGEISEQKMKEELLQEDYTKGIKTRIKTLEEWMEKNRNLYSEERDQKANTLKALRSQLEIVKEIYAEERARLELRTKKMGGKEVILSDEAAFAEITRVSGGGAGGRGAGRTGGIGQGLSTASEGLGKGGGNVIAEIIKAIQEIDNMTSAIASAITPLLDAIDAAAAEFVKTGDAGKAMNDVLIEVGKKIPIIDDVINVTEALGKAIDAVVNAEKNRENYLRDQAMEQRATTQGLLWERARVMADSNPTLLLDLINNRMNELLDIYTNKRESLTYDDILQIEIEITKLTKERAEYQKDITKSVKEQISVIQQFVNSGLIDVENIAAQGKINMLLDQSGVTGLARMEAITSLGLQGQNIGTINIEVNEATGNTVEAALQARMIALFGGN